MSRRVLTCPGTWERPWGPFPIPIPCQHFPLLAVLEVSVLPTLPSPTPVSASALCSYEVAFKGRCTQAPHPGALASAASVASLAAFLGQGMQTSIC